jgi:hypothetical protein
MVGVRSRHLAATAVSAFIAVACLSALLVSPAPAATASWSFEPSSWDFGIRLPGSGRSAPKAFALTNTGQTELTVGFVSLGSGPDPDLFAITENRCDHLAAGASCEIEVTFDPSTAGPKSGDLSVSTLDGTVEPASVQLRGTGAGPAVSITPQRQTFAPLPLHADPSAPKSFTVANEGQLDLAISSLSLQPEQTYNYPGATPAQFKLAGGSCAAGVVVPPGKTCTVDVAFAPSAPGLLTAQLRIVDNAPGSLHVAAIEGNGIGPSFILPGPATRPAPHAVVFRHPPIDTTVRSAVFWFRSSPAAARFECKLDHGHLHLCQSPVRYPHLGEGQHVFAVRAIADSGLSATSPTQFKWRIR